MNPSMPWLAFPCYGPFSNESSDTDYAVSVFISNLFYAVDDGGKNNERFRYDDPIVFVFLFFKLRYRVCIIKFKMPEL
jgi:hypothetical protein